jgi:nucleoside 2-deoxyribosyltransferase
MKVFLAAPLFSDAEREFNSRIAMRLRHDRFEVWLAQEAPFVHTGTHKEKKIIYECDVSALKTCEVMVAVLDGVEVDAGVAYEMGYAKALGKPIVGFKTDHRTFSGVEEVNLMLEVPLAKICKTIDELVDTLGKMR